MKLKRYIQFIKESLKEDLESGSIYELSEEQIGQYLIELSDAGYLIDVSFGFSEKVTRHYYNRPSVEKEVYSEKILSGEDVRPAYWIQIQKSRDVNNEDVTDSLKFACSIIEDEAEADISLHDSDTDVDPNTTLIKGGIFINVDPEDNLSGEEANIYIAIFAKQKNTIKITPKDLEEYYGWSVESKKGDILCAEIELEDLADIILETRSDYKDSLIGGQEQMWDFYELSNYYPEINSLFQYSLDGENEVLLAKSLIKEMGDFKQAINHIGEVCDGDIYEAVKEMSQEELINYLLGERFYKTIKKLLTGSEVFDEIRETVANWEMSAHCDDNHREIVSAFDSIVSDELGQYEKVVKEVAKSYITKGSKKVEYTDDVTYYQFPYTNDWISEIDSEYLFNKDLDQLFRDWVSESNINAKLNPRISDGGYVNKVDMNKDIKAYLRGYLAK